ncbi:MAG: hypothetical protein ACP5JN_01980 [Candidatus Micrarchaeia archaeon]|jgi:hypothetical protein
MESLFGEKLFAYSFYFISVTALLLAVAFGSSILAFLSVPFALFSIAYLYSGKLINNAIIKSSRMLIVSKGYELSNNLCSAVSKKGRFYESISIAVIFVNSPLNAGNASFQQILEKVKVPFEYSIELKELSRKNILDDLETKLHIKEIELANARSEGSKDVNRIRREIAVIENEIKAISSGSKPFDVKFKIKCKAISTSLIDAATTSERNAEYVASLFASNFNAGYALLKGESLLEEI